MPTQREPLEDVFAALKALLERHARGLEALDSIPGSQAKARKPGYYLYGKKEVAAFGSQARKVYVAGIMQHPQSIGFYSMPLYTHPADCPLSAELQKLRSGKSCLQIRTAAPDLLLQLEALLKAGLAAYRRAGWV